MAYHLSKESYGYCYRIRVPLQIQSVVGLTEIKYSLKTGSIRKAKQKAKQISANVKHLFKTLIDLNNNEARDTMPKKKTITMPEIKRIIAEYVRQVVDDSEEILASQTGFLSPDDMSEELNLIEDFKAECQEALATNDFRPAYDSVDRIIKSKGLDIKKGSQTYKNLCYEMMIAKVQLCDIQRKQTLGDYSYRDSLINKVNTDSLSEPQASISLSELAKYYWNEQSPN